MRPARGAGRVALARPTPGSPSRASRTGRCRRRARRRRPPATRVDRLAALLAADRHAVDPRPAELLELVEPSSARSRELRLRADHVQVPARARIERQRQAVVAAARDVPVAHVAQPVVHALAHVLGHPLDLRVRLEQLRPELLDRDEPVVGEPEDQRRVAAPAVRIAVRVERRPRRGMPVSPRSPMIWSAASVVERPCSQP